MKASQVALAIVCLPAWFVITIALVIFMWFPPVFILLILWLLLTVGGFFVSIFTYWIPRAINVRMEGK